jgi:uncharacterized protein YrrD
MLLSGSRLIGTPIMGLQTGTKLAATKIPIIDPANLKIIAYEVDGPMLAERPSLIRIADVRELSSVGMIVDSNDEFVNINDVISIKKIYDLGFRLIGMAVIDEHKHKLGKVVDYGVDTDGFVIQQLNVRPGLLKSITETELLIHRSQIVEINDFAIIVKSAAKKLMPLDKPINLSFVNPFRSNNPQTNNTKINRSF